MIKELFLVASILMLPAICMVASAQAQTRSSHEEQTLFSAEDVRVKVSAGVDYSSGDYGDAEDTEIWYAPVTGKIQKGDVAVKITVPYIRIKGPGNVIGNGDALAFGAVQTTTNSGLGDVIGAVTYTHDIDDNTYLDLTGKVKFPTADEDKGLGTGATDFTAYAEMTHQFEEAYVFAGGGYKVVGDKGSLDLNNVILLSAGAGTDVSESTDVGASYDWRQSASDGDNPSEASAYVSHKLTKRLTVQAYGVTGFSDASPDYGGGLSLGYKLYTPKK